VPAARVSMPTASALVRFSSSSSGSSGSAWRHGRLLEIAGALVLVGVTATGTVFVITTAADMHEDMPHRQHGNMMLNPMESVKALPRSVLGILAINVLVFFLHRVLPIHLAYKHLFTSFSHVQAGQYHTLLTSTFSHQDLFHLAANCIGLYMFAPPVIQIIGERDFTGIYLVAGVVSSILAVASTRVIGSRRLQSMAMSQPSLGASGAVCAVVGLSAVFFPDKQYSILGLSPWIRAEHLVPGLMLFDVAGVVYMWVRDRLSGIGHVAHISGILFGYLTAYTYLNTFNERAKRRLQYLEFKKKAGLR